MNEEVTNSTMAEHGDVSGESFLLSEKGIKKDGDDGDAGDNIADSSSNLFMVNCTPLVPSYQLMEPTEPACQQGMINTNLDGES